MLQAPVLLAPHWPALLLLPAHLSPLRLKVPGTTQNGQTFRLKGHGMPTTNRPESGDLYATAEVQLPKALTPEQRTHFEALAELDKGTTS